MDYRIDLAQNHIAGFVKNTGGPNTTVTKAIAGLTAGKAITWTVSVWDGDRLIRRGPVQYHTT